MTVLLFFISFVYYLVGLCGTMPAYRDSGDLIASIQTLGIAHPPGYALYVLLGKLFVTALPFGPIAYRVNAMSAFFAAATAVILYRLLSSPAVTGRGSMDSPPATAGNDVKKWTGLVVVLLFTTSPAVIALARVAEMYTLSSCLAAAILYCLLSEHPHGPSWAALLLGLGLSVHPTLIFLIPLFFIAPARSLTRTTGMYFLLGLCVFLYLPIRASQHPLLNWGDPSQWRNFWRVVTRADYGGLKLHPEQSLFSWTPESILAQLRYFIFSFAGEWGWAALALGLTGIVIGLRKPENRAATTAVLISWLLSGPGFFLLSNLPLAEPTTPTILQPYYLLAGVLWTPFVGMALANLWPAKTWINGAIALAFLAVTAPNRSIPASQRNDFYAYDYARNLLRSLPPGAVLYDPDDPTHFSIQVLQTVEKRRTDVVLLNFFRTRWGYEQIKRRWPDLLPPIPIESGQELQRLLWTYSARQRPFYAELPQKFGQIPYHAEGLVYAALIPSSSTSRAHAEALLDLYVQRGDFVTTHHPDFFTRHLISYYAASQNNLGIEYANIGEWRQAVQHYQAALKMEPDQAAAQSNLSIALQKMRKLI